MPRRINIMIAEPSVIIRRGLVAVLKELSALTLKITEVPQTDMLYSALQTTDQDILIINPGYLGMVTPDQLRKDCDSPDLKIIALQNSMADTGISRLYDDTLSVYDKVPVIQDKLEKLSALENDSDKNQLSAREKEIVALIAKGLSNKEISDKLFVSTYTIMTHRRNIMNKLKIHSPAGLTIYAIVNKLIDITEVKDL